MDSVTATDIDCAQGIVAILKLDEAHILPLAEFRAVTRADARRQAVEEIIAHYRAIQDRHPDIMVPWQAIYVQYGPAMPEDIARARELFPALLPPARPGGGA